MTDEQMAQLGQSLQEQTAVVLDTIAAALRDLAAQVASTEQVGA